MVRIIEKHLKYIIMFAILLIIEIFIGKFINEGFIRDYGGDILIIPLLYTFVRIFFANDSKAAILYLPLGLLVLGVCAEIVQACNLIAVLGIRKNSLLGIIIGSTFDWKDILCYLAGTVSILGWNYKKYVKVLHVR
jgi:hypothetical protein